MGPLPSSGDNLDQVRCWAAYELMMHRLFMAFYPFKVLDQEDARLFYDTYQTLQDGSNPLYAYMALRYFELGLEFFMRRGIKIVFMFDEFEDFLRLMPVKFFLTLRGLRDANKRQLSFLTFTRSPLPVMEPFIELFTDNVCYVGPYNEADSVRMVEELINRNQKSLNRSEVEFLLWSTGRYAGLIRAAFRVIDSLGLSDSRFQQEAEPALHQLSLKLPIRAECKTLWLSLSHPEKYILKAVARLASYTTSAETEQAVTSLVQKRLLRVDRIGHKLEIDPPVFRAFILSDPEIASS
jgi:hypothetical protein